MEFTTEKIRNFVLIGHGDAGKTSLAECFLFTAGEIKRIGSVEEGTTVSDYHKDEIERQISINSSLMHCTNNDNKINIIDTPGYVDFTGDVKSALHAVGLGAVVINCVAGIEVGTEVVWGYCKEQTKPRFLILNKIDKVNNDYDSIISKIKSAFTSKVVEVQFPANPGSGFDSIVDLLGMKLFKYAADGSGKYTIEDIPADLKEKADKMREELKESVAETDDDLLEKYLEEGDITDEELTIGFRNAMINVKIFPFLCASSEKNVGPLSILDFVSKYCPNPAEFPSQTIIDQDTGAKTTITIDSNSYPLLQVFKTISEAHVGELSFFKCSSGIIKPGTDLYNSNRQSTERIGQVFIMNGHNRTEVNSIVAGDIGAVVKLKDTHTGDTLSPKDKKINLPEIEYPNPIIRMAIKPKTKGDEAKISTGLHRLHEEDPSFKVTVDAELHQTIISGQGELHLETIIKRLEQKSGIGVETEDPKIPYREAIRGTVKAHGKYKKQSGGKGQYGDTHIEISPLPRGTGFVFENAIVGGSIPSKFIPAVEKGIREQLVSGVIAGCKVIDLKVKLYDGTYHNVDSSDMSFKIAGAMAFKKAFLEAKPVLLEPIYEVEVKVPEDYMGDVMGDLSSRRGKIMGTEADGSFQVIKAKVPLAELYKYSTSLRSMTSGRGIHKRKFSAYENMPGDVMKKVISEYEASKTHSE